MWNKNIEELRNFPDWTQICFVEKSSKEIVMGQTMDNSSKELKAVQELSEPHGVFWIDNIHCWMKFDPIPG